MISDEALKVKILGLLLKPLARFCFRHSLSHQDLVAVAKSAFVTAAVEELKGREEKVNTSRVSAMTGIIRREVKRLIEDPDVGEYQPSLLARVVSLWESDKRFNSRPGAPRELSCGFNESEFNQLVYSISLHLNAGTLLYELERTGMVKRDGDQIRLVKRIDKFRTDPERGFQMVANDIDTVLCSAEENMVEKKPISNLHIRTEYDNIYESDLAKIRRWLVDEGKRFHKRARDFISQFDKDVNPRAAEEKAGVKVSFTAVSFTSVFPDHLDHIPEPATPEDV